MVASAAPGRLEEIKIDWRRWICLSRGKAGTLAEVIAFGGEGARKLAEVERTAMLCWRS